MIISDTYMTMVFAKQFDADCIKVRYKYLYANKLQ